MDVFRKRLEHRKKKEHERKSKKPEVPMEAYNIQTKAKAGLEFLEVVNAEENEQMN